MDNITKGHHALTIWLPTGIIIYLFVPILINKLISLSTPQLAIDIFGEVVGETDTWINFWAVYLSGAIPFIILFFTIRNNNKQNHENRLSQLNSFSYQVYLNRISEYKNAIQEVLSIMNRTRIDEFIILIKNGDIKKREPYVKGILDKLNIASNNFRITFANNLDSVENKFLLQFEDFRILFSDILKDILWISFQGLVDSFGNSELDRFQKSLETYKMNNASSTYAENHRVWSIIANGSIDNDSFPYSTIERLASCDISCHFYNEAMNFIKYENNKAIDILNGKGQNK